MKSKLIVLAAMAMLMAPGAVFAGCDYDVSDSELVIAEQMSEQQILDLIAATRDASAPVEQAQTQTEK